MVRYKDLYVPKIINFIFRVISHSKRRVHKAVFYVSTLLSKHSYLKVFTKAN